MTLTITHYQRLLSLFIAISLFGIIKAQEADTLVLNQDTAFIEGIALDLEPAQKVHSPHKASFYAAILPGLGQIYNKKYWKLPILYGGIAATGYAIHFNSKYYNIYKTAYRDYILQDPGNTSYLELLKTKSGGTIVSVESIMPGGSNAAWFESVLQDKKEYYKRYRDLSYIIMVGVYVIQIVDAAVDAHFYNFDISDDLSMRVSPAMMPPAPGEFGGLGLQLNLNF